MCNQSPIAVQPSKQGSEHQNHTTLLWPDLRERVVLPEWMDDPALPRAMHEEALRGLRRIHTISGTARQLWQTIHQHFGHEPTHQIRVLDVGCAEGHLARALLNISLRHRQPMIVDGCDISAQALSMARQQDPQPQGVSRWFELDATRDPIPREYDVIVNSLVMHHLSQDDVVKLMRGMTQAAKAMVLIHDLRRCRMGYLASYLGTRLLTRSPVVHYDGPQSVRAAFTTEQWRQLMHEAGWDQATLRHRGPWRVEIQWRQPKQRQRGSESVRT